MARALWSGSLSFGLVNVPVQLVSAVRDLDLHFRQLHAKDKVPIEQRRFCSKEDVEVTIEANPDTVTEPSLSALVDAGFARLSIGAQSFDPAVLRVQLAEVQVEVLDRAHQPDGHVDQAEVERAGPERAGHQRLASSAAIRSSASCCLVSSGSSTISSPLALRLMTASTASR